MPALPLLLRQAATTVPTEATAMLTLRLSLLDRPAVKALQTAVASTLTSVHARRRLAAAADLTLQLQWMSIDCEVAANWLTPAAPG